MTTIMKKVTLTYHAPPGDAKMVEAYGQMLLDGEGKECLVPEAELAKLRNNRHFEVGKETDVEAPHAELTEAEVKAAEEKDAAKLAAQGPNPPQRGAILNKEPPPEVEGAASTAPKSEKSHQAGTQHPAGAQGRAKGE